MIFFEADYEAHQPLGLLLQACKVTYSIGNHGQPTIVACCVVFDPTKNTGIDRGDVLVSVNGLALIDPDHDVSDENQLDAVKSRLTSQTHLPRTLRFFRHSGAEFDERNVGAWYDSTVLGMTKTLVTLPVYSTPIIHTLYPPSYTPHTPHITLPYHITPPHLHRITTSLTSSTVLTGS